MLKVFFLDIAPWIAYAFFVIAPLIQTARLIKRKRSEDISLGFLSLSITAQVILVPRLLLITGDALLLTGHVAATVATIAMLIVVLHYRKKAPPA